MVAIPDTLNQCWTPHLVVKMVHFDPYSQYLVHFHIVFDPLVVGVGAFVAGFDSLVAGFDSVVAGLD